MLSRWFLVPLVVGALALGLAACGDDDDTDTATAEATEEAGEEATSTPDDTEGEAAGGAICEAFAEIAAFNEGIGDPPEGASFEEEKEHLLEGLRGLEERYNALDDVPSEIEGDLETFTAFLSSTIEALEPVTSQEEGEEVLGEVPSDVADARQSLATYVTEECDVDLF